MPTVVPEDFARVIHSLQWLNDPEPMAVTYGVKVIPTAAPNAVAQEAHEAFALVMTEISVEVSLQSTDVLIQDTAPPAPEIVGTYANVVNGAAGGAVIPQNSAYLVHKRTGFAGRVGRGRMFLPGVGETVVDNTGNVSAGKLTGLNAQLALFLAELNDGPNILEMSLLHNSPGAGALLPPYAITSLVMDTRIATQRRRLRK